MKPAPEESISGLEGPQLLLEVFGQGEAGADPRQQAFHGQRMPGSPLAGRLLECDEGLLLRHTIGLQGGV